jgi:hypothetical protein
MNTRRVPRPALASCIGLIGAALRAIILSVPMPHAVQAPATGFRYPSWLPQRRAPRANRNDFRYIDVRAYELFVRPWGPLEDGGIPGAGPRRRARAGAPEALGASRSEMKAPGPGCAAPQPIAGDIVSTLPARAPVRRRHRSSAKPY